MNGMLSRERSVLLVVDVQEGFRSYECFEDVCEAAQKLVTAAQILGVPVLVSEQYPKGLGTTAIDVGDAPRIEKTVFSAVRAEGFDLHGRDQVLVCGIEAHVCVSQTVLDLLGDGIEVHVPVDAIGSRNDLDYEVGVTKMERAGAVPSSVETALLELCERAGTPEFKEVQALIK